MCNLNILIRKEINTDIKGFMQSVTANSFILNNDSEGVYLNYQNRLIKSKNKIDYTKLKGIDKSKIIISHQRIATSGFNLKYSQPFINKDFVIVHNGVINQFKKNKGSDTFGFWIDFNKEFNKILNKDIKKDRNQAVKKAIQNLFKEDSGFYSIFIYDKKTDTSYYFKDITTNIKIVQSKNYIFITTSENNLKFLTLLKEKFKHFDIKERVIYKIKNHILFNCEKLAKSEYSYIDTTDNSEISRTSPAGAKKTDTTQQEFKIDDYYCYNNRGGITTPCDYCNKPMFDDVYLFNSELVCEECLTNHFYRLNKNRGDIKPLVAIK